MVIAGLVIETVPGSAPRVAARLALIEELVVHGGDGDRRIAAVWSAADGESLDGMAGELLRGDGEIVGVFPTFVGDDQEAAG